MKRIIFKAVRRIILDSKLSFKMIVFIIFISTIPLLFMGVVFDNKMQEIFSEELGASYEQVVKQYVSNINYKIDIYQTLLVNISSNRTISELLSKKDINSYTDVYDIGNKISDEVGSLLGARKTSELRNIMVYLYNEDVPVYASKVTNVKMVKDEEWYVKMHDESTKQGFFTYTLPGTKKDILSFTKQLVGFNGENYGQRLGFVKLDIYADGFYRFHDSFQFKHDKDIFILDNNGAVIWGSDSKNLFDLPKVAMNQILNNNSGKDYIEVSGKKKAMLYRAISRYGWKVLFLFDYDEMDEQAREARKVIVFYVIGVSIIMSGLTILFSKKFSKRIDQLIKKMEKVENGDLSITEKIVGNDEIGIVDNHFNKMVGRLNELINSNYVQQLERREAELNALQFQINPHFLYNTLESINSLASISGCFEICEISHKLGEMFRYSINIGSSEFISLEKEIKHIENYVYIQKIRFHDKFEVFYNIDESASRCKVLKLILQPIVENAIVHGFEHKTGMGCLEVSAVVCDGRLVISIDDDGKGMTEEQENNLNNYINEREDYLITGYRKSIGIKNVNMRIKLACGEDYGVLIRSKKDVGTQVEITLPAYI